MNLKKFTPENCVSGRSNAHRPAAITMKKNGYLNFNGKAAAIIGLSKGDHFVILQDEQEPENWYIQKVDDGGFVLRSKTPSGFCIQNASLVRAIMDSIGANTDKTVRMLLAGQPTKDGKQLYWGILTNTASWDGKKI